MEKNSIFKSLKKILEKTEEYSLVFFLSVMILSALLQIIFRIGFDITEKLYAGIVNFKFWGILKDFNKQLAPIIKYSVLWSGLIAAGIATSLNHHIKIDIVGKFTRGRLRSFILIVTNLIAAAACFVITYYSIIYIIEVEYTSKEVPPFFNIPSWVLVLILPFGFGVMAIRFLFRMIIKIINFVKNVEDETDDDDSFTVELEESE
jgi:TRAP-type C4-dicarboxylate transport system permease small subunit